MKYLQSEGKIYIVVSHVKIDAADEIHIKSRLRWSPWAPIYE